MPALAIVLGGIAHTPVDPVVCSAAGWAFVALTAPLVSTITGRVELRLHRARRRADEAGDLAKRIMHASVDGIFLIAPDGPILLANPAACQMLGYSEKQLLRGGRKLFLDEEDAEVRAFLTERATTGRAEGELWLVRSDGRHIRAQASSQCFPYHGEQRSAVVVRDVTERNQSAYYGRLAEVLFESDGIFIVITDTSWRALWGSAGAERISGFRAIDVIGDQPPFYKHMRQVDPETMEQIEQTLERDGVWTGDLESVRQDGSVYELHGNIRRVEGPLREQARYVAVFTDRASLVPTSPRIDSVRLNDPITGLPTRSHFEMRLQDHLAAVEPLAIATTVFLVEIDHLASVNESLGHRYGDEALCQAVQRLKAALGPKATVVRNGGAGFFAFTPENVASATMNDAPTSARAIVEAFRHSLDLFDRHATLTVSIGMSACPTDADEVVDLMRKAEMALQSAKEAGGDTARSYGSAAGRIGYLSIATALREDLDQGRVHAYFQPIVDARTRVPVAMEALARWRRDDRGWISPAEFVPVAERTGLADKLSEVILDQSCDHLAAVQQAGIGRLPVNVNLSARQLRDEGVADRILATIRDKGIEPSLVTIEITESMLVQDADRAATVLHRLRAEGVSVTLDDFGTGYSSLTYLKAFEVDGLKIDRSFVANLPHDPKETAILHAILSVAHQLGIHVVAEGVERDDQAEFLESAGCQFMQGFLFGPAVSSAEFISRYTASGDPVS